MSNKTQLQANNDTLSTLTERVAAAKETVAALPDSGGGASLDFFDNLTIQTKKNPMGSSPTLVSSIIYVNGYDGSCACVVVDNPPYMTRISPVVGTFIYIKTTSSATGCTALGSALELVEFNATTGAIVKVVNNNTTDNPIIRFS